MDIAALSDAVATLRGIAENIGRVMQGQEETTRTLLAAFAGGGHVLLEDYPGTGKTTLAKALARSIDADFQRIQFTPDLLPTDILGVSIYEGESRGFNFHRGPVFTNILLADEINRASPRTQSALLEAMAENQVSVEGEATPLEQLFFVIATQNPVEFHGTYPLPEAQMDRFALRFNLGYVSQEQEVGILTAQNRNHPLDAITACSDRSAVESMRRQVPSIRMSNELEHYIVTLVRETRSIEGITLGASPRASLALMKASKALALYDDMGFVTPDHIQELTIPVLAHRISLDPQARFSGLTTEGVVRQILARVAAPS